MTKKELIKSITMTGPMSVRRAKGEQISEALVEDIIDAFADLIRSELQDGNQVTVPGIGKFSVADRAAKTGRNPQTGEAIQIAAKRVVKFSVAKALKDAAVG